MIPEFDDQRHRAQHARASGEDVAVVLLAIVRDRELPQGLSQISQILQALWRSLPTSPHLRGLTWFQPLLQPPEGALVGQRVVLVR